MSNREGLAVLCIAGALVVVGVIWSADLIAGLGGFFAILGLAILAWNLLAEDSEQRGGD